MRKPADHVRLMFIRPMDPELVEQPPKGWGHEVKFDGYRTQVIKDADGIRFYTKNGFDWTAKYRPLSDEANAIDAGSFVIEGETIVTNEAGLSDFHALRFAITKRGKAGAPPPKGLAKEKAEWLKPGLVGRVKFLKGEEKGLSRGRLRACS
ncbi:hypothetical protein [Mesorhizobium argentiipisi]|uniref:ATP-dependent DNA ligase family profile domain-containing protein n=1 Tax=Mesorhizobium argentiipisi TaxID=3015175 RepID=A0ABU8KI61_9HYPH